MKLQLRELARSVAAGASAVLASVVAGAFAGYSNNPADSQYHQQFLLDYLAANPVNTSEQLDRAYAQLAAHAHPPAPLEVVAILQSNPALLLPLGLACWLVARPTISALVLVTSGIAVALFALAGAAPAIAFAGSSLAYLLAASLFPKLRRDAA